MQLSPLLVLAAIACAAPRPAVELARAPRPPVPLEDYFKIRRILSRSGVLLAFSHDEQRVAYLSDEGGRTDIWVQPVGGGPGVQVSHVQGFIQGFAFSPTDDTLAYTSDVGGDELPHLFLTDATGRAPTDVTADLPAGGRADFVDWAADGQSLLYVSSARDPRALDLYEYTVKTGRSERVWEATGRLSFANGVPISSHLVSADHRRFVVTEMTSVASTNIYLAERDRPGELELLTPHAGDVLVTPYHLTDDGKTLYYTSDEGREFAGLFAMDLATRAVRPVAQPEWDVIGAGVSRTSRYLHVTTNVDGQPRLEVRDTRSRTGVSLPAPPPGGAWVPIAWSPGDRYLGVWLQSDAAPNAPYVIDLTTGRAHKLIEPLPASLRGRDFAVGENVRVTSFDGREVPALLYKPRGAGPFPAVIDVHGGPTSQSTRDFRAFRQYLVSKGYAVLVPNVRGSTGYGKTYTGLDNHDLGGGPLKDVVACKAWLVEHAGVDPQRVVVMGASYGGYMALAAATFTPTEFAAIVDFYGVSDLKSDVENIPAYWEPYIAYFHKKWGNPRDPADAAYQHDRSPLYFLDRVQRPLLVVQGDRDARVTKVQSDRVVAALEARRAAVHYLVIKDEGHGFSRTESLVAAYSATDRFLDRYLWGDARVEVVK